MTTKHITVVTGIVFNLVNNKPHVLLCQRDEPDCPGAHLKWELPGGKVKRGETPMQAVAREIKEETGILGKPVKLLQYVHTGLWQYPNHEQFVLVFCYLCQLEGGKIKVQDHHIKNVKWQPLAKIDDLKLLPGIKEVLKEAAKEINL